jgi:hypothetical protein
MVPLSAQTNSYGGWAFRRLPFGEVESTTLVRGDACPEAIQKAVSISTER